MFRVPFPLSPIALANRLPWQLPWVTEYWDGRYGVTASSERVSAWGPRKGSHDFEQGTTNAQPIYLPFSGTRYLWLPGVSGNYASTPDSAALSITGPIDIRVRAGGKWSGFSAGGQIVGKDNGSNQRSFALTTNAAKLRFFYTSDGSTATGRVADSSANVPFSDFANGWVRVTYDTATGDVKFYTATDSSEPTAWTQLGTTQSITSGAIQDGSAALTIGANSTGTAGLTSEPIKVYRAQIYDGIDGTKVFDADFTAVSEGATSFTESANGATVTINSTGAKPAQIVGSPSLLFDGSAYYMRWTDTLAQPFTWLMVGKPVAWNSGDHILNGSGTNVAVFQNTSTPRINLFAGSIVANNEDFVVGVRKVLAATFNGASSSLAVNLGTAVTGNPGSNNPGGMTIGADYQATAADFSNIQVWAVALCTSALTASQRAQTIRAMAAQHGVSIA